MKIVPKISIWLGGALLLMAAGIAFMFWSYQQISVAASERQHTREVISIANDLLSGLKDAETGQRGYALTGKEAYLQPYLAVRDRVIPELKALRELNGGDDASGLLSSMAPLIEAKMVDLANGIALSRAGDLNAVRMQLDGGTGEQLMAQIRTGMNSFILAQTTDLLRTEASFDAGMRRLLLTLSLVAGLALLLTVVYAYLIYQKSLQRVKDLVHLETLHLLEAQEASNRQLQASEQKLQVTLSSIGDGVIATDAAACVTLLNPVAQALTGMTQAQAIGRPIAEVLHIVNKETRARVRIPVADTLAHGTVQGLANHTVLISRDGREFDIADSCAPIRSADGLVVGAVLVIRDISEEYAVQQSLREAGALQKAIFDSANFSSIATDAKGVIQIFNVGAQRMLGYTAAEVVNQRTPADISDSQEVIARAKSLSAELQTSITPGFEALVFKASRGIEDIYELTYIRKDGSRFPAVVSVTALRDEQGSIIGYLLIGTDNTARKQVEAERARLDQVLQNKNAELERARRVADHANQAKSDFLSSMSHELRSPLNAILGFAQLLESGAPPPSPEQAASVAQILKAGWYLLKLINEILDLTLIESGRLSLSLEPTSLHDVLHDCHAMIEPQAQQKGIRIKFAPVAGDCFVIADRTRLKQVLVNLLSNAIKYNRPSGTAEVTYQLHSGGRLRISVRDSGEGLSPGKISQLFQPFNRLGQEAGAEEGTGIGLVVSRQLVELMGGEIGVTSTVGVGSVFWFELNAAQAPEFLHDAKLPLLVPETLPPPGASVRTLLYVEDNQANMALVEQLVARRPDLRLLGAEDAMRGIAMARAHQPDLILMDLNLPGISGMQALAILQADASTRHIPVLALSANAMPRDIEKGMEAGFFRYLTKPIRVSEFMAALDEGLALAADHVP